jgi:hypothetical protein
MPVIVVKWQLRMFQFLIIHKSKIPYYL